MLLKLWHFLTTRNPRADYPVYDALDHAPFTRPAAYMQHVHGLYLRRQARHLDRLPRQSTIA